MITNGWVNWQRSQIEVNKTYSPTPWSLLCIYFLLTRDSAGEESDALEVEVPDRAEHVPLAEGPVGAEEELNETLDVWEVDRRLHLHGRHER